MNKLWVLLLALPCCYDIHFSACLHRDVGRVPHVGAAPGTATRVAVFRLDGPVHHRPRCPA